jgi:hypothetical protein
MIFWIGNLAFSFEKVVIVPELKDTDSRIVDKMGAVAWSIERNVASQLGSGNHSNCKCFNAG